MTDYDVIIKKHGSAEVVAHTTITEADYKVIMEYLKLLKEE